MPGSIEEQLKQLVNQVTNDGGLSQMIQQNTIAGQVPMANLLLPALLKKMGAPDVMQFSPNMGRTLRENRHITIADGIWQSNPKYSNTTNDTRRAMLTNLLAKGADPKSAEYARAREYANKTVEMLPQIDRVGGMFGVDVGGERLLNQMTRGVGDLETSAASIVRATSKRFGAASSAVVRERSKEVIDYLDQNTFEASDVEGERRVKKDFREATGGMSLDDFASTYEVLSREGALNRNTKQAIQEVKGMGDVINEGKAIFGDEASPEVILAAARELHGSIKPSDKEEIKKAFQDVAAVLEQTQLSATEYFAKVQEIQDFAKSRGSYMSSKEAGKLVADRALRVQAMVDSGVDRTKAVTLANKEAEMSARMSTSGAEDRANIALMAAGGDTAIADKLLKGEAVDPTILQSYIDLQTSRATDTTGAVAQSIREYSKDDKSKAWAAKKKAEAVSSDLKTEWNASSFATQFESVKTVGDINTLSQKLAATGGDKVKLAEVAKEYNVAAGTVAAVYQRMNSSGDRLGQNLIAGRVSAQEASGDKGFSEAQKAQAAQIEINKKAEAAAREKATKAFDPSNYQNVHSWMTTGKGNIIPLEEVAPDMVGLSAEENKVRRAQVDKQMRAAAAFAGATKKQLIEFGYKQTGAELANQQLEGLAANNVPLAKELTSQIGALLKPEDIGAVLKELSGKGQGEDSAAFKDSLKVSDAVSKANDKTKNDAQYLLNVPKDDTPLRDISPAVEGARVSPSTLGGDSKPQWVDGVRTDGKFGTNASIQAKPAPSSGMDAVVNALQANTSALLSVRGSTDGLSKVIDTAAVNNTAEPAPDTPSGSVTSEPTTQSSNDNTTGYAQDLAGEPSVELSAEDKDRAAAEAKNKATMDRIKEEEKVRNVKRAEDEKKIKELEGDNSGRTNPVEDLSIGRTAAATVPTATEKEPYNAEKFLKELDDEVAAKKAASKEAASKKAAANLADADKFINELDAEDKKKPLKETDAEHSARIEAMLFPKDTTAAPAAPVATESKSGDAPQQKDASKDVVVKLVVGAQELAKQVVQVLHK